MKSLRLILSLCILAAAAGLLATAGAAEPASVRVESVRAEPGSTVQVAVSIEHNPGILGTTLEVTFPSQLTLLKAENGAAFSALNMTPSNELSSPCRFVWDGDDLEDSQIRDGTILTLTFRVSEAATAGSALSIQVTCPGGDATDRDLNPVSLSAVDGTVTVGGSGVLTAEGIRTASGLQVRISSPEASTGVSLVLTTCQEKTGQMTDCQLRSLTLSKGETTVKDLTAPGPGQVCRAFLLDGAGTPLCPAILFPPAST